MLKGQCLCGGVSYRLESDLIYLYQCHCVQCRAFSGASAATNATINGEDFHLEDPEGLLSRYKTPTGQRFFCSRCGGPIYSHGDGFEAFPSLHCGSLNPPPDRPLDAHFWLQERCPWTEIADGAGQFDRFPPNLDELFNAPTKD